MGLQNQGGGMLILDKMNQKMTDKIRDFFKTTPFQKSYTDRMNLQVGMSLCIFRIIMDAVLLFTGIKSAGFGTPYSLSTLLLLAANIVFLFFAYFALVKHWCERLSSVFIYVYIIVSFGFGLFIAYCQGLTLASFYTYMVMQCAILVLFSLNPICVFVLMASSLFIVGWMYYQLYGNYALGLSSSGKANILILELTIFFISTVHYIIVNLVAKTQERFELLTNSLKKVSYYDALTSLKNRHALREDFPSYIGKNLVVMMTDVDDFKFFNDVYGHDLGDKILQHSAAQLIGVFGEKAPYRFGGDEFLVIREDINAFDFKNLAESWRKGIGNVKYNENSITPSCSGGFISGTPDSEAMLNQMIQYADMELYKAKARGKNLIVGCDYSDVCDGENEEGNFAKVFNPSSLKNSDKDILTDLPNLMYFRNKAMLLLNNSKNEHNDNFAFVCFDIDRFKSYNEQFGFSAGDELIRGLANILKAIFKGKLITRPSADRFLVLDYGTDLEKRIIEVHDRLLSSFNQKVRCGAYLFNDFKEDISVLWDRAKMASDSIGDRYDIFYAFYTSAIQERIDRNHYIIENFSKALDSGQIYIDYQPIIDVSTGKVCDVEALARWKDPEMGVISPDDFIRELENAHLTLKLDLFVIRKVAKDYRRYLDTAIPPVPVSVNVSHVDFETSDLARDIDNIMSDYSLPRSAFSIEMRESSFMDDSTVLKKHIDDLHKAGFKVWLDNFGRGYSSLNLLNEYDFDLVKIDMKFMKEFSNEKARVIISHIIKMTREMGSHVLAEGVETKKQLDFLKEAGCEKAQGYLFSVPLSFDSFLEKMKGSSPFGKSES